MSCKDYKYLIEAFVEGTIDVSGLETLQEHVAICPACRKEYEDFSKLRCFVEEAFVSATSPAQVAEAIKEELSSSASMPGANQFGPKRHRWLTAAACIGAVFLVLHRTLSGLIVLLVMSSKAS